MKLAEYREEQNLTLEALAALLDMPYGTVLSYVYGKRVPGLARAQKIHQKTAGAVTMADWFPDQDVETAPAPEDASTVDDDGNPVAPGSVKGQRSLLSARRTA